MYLKEINATGFKSFADKLDIKLDDKITCIVGPNGSGKSNVVDAIRWVLGEQSVKSLRGDNAMSDIIFSGSKSRNPLNVASVSLTFDNTDNYISCPYSEITIKRRVYKTGENEYFLNGEKVRLKDITDLFLDSGVNKESYNIISQGEIGKILSNSSYERRSIFESAAGVLKYKKRKEEALKKLDKTKDNMDRVNDIIGELEVQVNPLKEQSIAAKEYLDLKEKLSNIELSLITYEIDSINYDYDVSRKKVEELKNKILDLDLKSNTDDGQIEQLKVEIGKLESSILEMNRSLLELTQEEEKLNGDKKLLQERSKYDAHSSKVYENVAKLKEELLKVDNSSSLIRKDIDVLEFEKDELNQKISKCELEFQNFKKKYNDLYNERSVKGLELIDVKHKIELLENSIDSGGNLSSSVKSILNNPRLVGVHQVIGNLVDVDEYYIKALEVSLLSNRQFIVVDDEDVAKRCVNYLKDNKLGRATFFPLSVIKPKGVDYDTLNKVKGDNGFVDVLINLLKYDDKYHNVIANLFGNILVAKTLDDANRISKKINQAYRIVTLSGDVINIGGSISGGSLLVHKSIIAEKRELEVLKHKRDELSFLIQDLDTELKDSEEINTNYQNDIYDLRKKLTVNMEELNSKNALFATYKMQREDISKEISNLDSVMLSSVSHEEEKIVKKYYEVSLQRENLTKDINLSTKEKDKLNIQLEQLQAKNKVDNQELKVLEKALQEENLKITKYDVKLDNYINILADDYEITYEQAKEKYFLDIDPSLARSDVNRYKSEIKKLGMVNLAAIDEYKRVSERYDFLTVQRDDLNKAKEALLEIISEMDKVMKEEFASTFDRIKEEFKKVFKELFKGGSADLRLTDPDNLLDTGIDIVASPPGKKLTSITLLSGGEKTLTAISLIFAILNVRTVPFCIFDEIEAALDEANVDTFGKYLKTYSNRTQFLIITHKKRTMEYADTLYGITMQESGVSKLVSVKLDALND